MTERLKKFFKLEEHGVTVGSELSAGLTTFFTMSYIVFVNPAILGQAGIDGGALFVATCLSAAFGTLLMGLLANYPIALAPAMGHNAFFAFTVCLTMGYTWQSALAAVCTSGLVFVALSFVGLREKLLAAVPSSIRYGISSGIGLFIALIGFEWSGIVAKHPATYVALGDLHRPGALLSLFGLAVTAVMLLKKIRLALLFGMALTTVAGLLTGVIGHGGMKFGVPSLAPTLFKLDFAGLFASPQFITVILIFLFLDLFDTVGTLVGVADKAGLLDEKGELPRARPALLSDALATVFGALLGTSTVTSYIESSAGTSAGARTGLSNLAVAGCFLLAVLAAPLVDLVGGGWTGPDGTVLYPVIAPALIVVGCLIASGFARIDWDEPGEALPAFLTMTVIPLTFSITDGIAFGFIAHTLLKAAAGKLREGSWLIHLFSLLFLIRYAFLMGS